MSSGEIALNLGLLAAMILTQWGDRAWSLIRVALPLAIVAAVGAYYLPGTPTSGGDGRLEVAGALVGAALGFLAAACIALRHEDDGRVTMRAGLAYALVWVVAIGGRIAFAYGANHLWLQPIGRFSSEHQITGAAAWRAAFVLMALAMVVARTLVLAARAALLPRAAAMCAR